MIVFMYIRQREPAKIVSKEWKLTIVFLRGLNVVSPECDGCIKALIVPGPAKWMGCMGREFEVFIPWCRIVKIGPDIILVDIDEKEAKHKVK